MTVPELMKVFARIHEAKGRLLAMVSGNEIDPSQAVVRVKLTMVEALEVEAKRSLLAVVAGKDKATWLRVLEKIDNARGVWPEVIE